MSSDQLKLKEKGNSLLKAAQYEHAVGWYIKSLEVNPSDYTTLSNRSLAYFRLGRFSEALQDADKCINLAPQFGRGYLRRATALNRLNMYNDAMLAAEKGYRCRQSDIVCKDCITQWLLACQNSYQELTDEAKSSFGLPTGIIILSKTTYRILKEAVIARITTAKMTQSLMIKCLLDISKEMNLVLEKFGHQIPSAVNDWIRGLESLALLVDPQTDSISKESSDKILLKGREFSESLSKTIDPILYPVLRPLVALCIIVICDRTYTLSCMNYGHQERQLLCESLLPLFDSSGILSFQSYIVSYLCTLSGLLQSFHGRRILLTKETAEQVHKYCQKMTEALVKLTPDVWEYEELKQICINNLSLAKDNAVIRQGSYITGDVNFEANALFGNKKPSDIVSLVQQHMKEVKSKQPVLYTVDDAEYLLHGSCKEVILHHYLVHVN